MASEIEEAIRYGKDKLGFESLRSHQVNVIKNYMQGNDVFLCAPTGTGKSLTFEIAPFIFKKYHNTDNATVIVISPLVALMTKQAEKCRGLGLTSVYVKGQFDQTNEDERITTVMESTSIQDIQSGEIDIIFASPETILGSHRELVLQLAKKKILKTIFIDEAHCISKFGKCQTKKKGQNRAFRPAYGKLGELRALAADIPVVALTATATQATRKIIIQEMCMDTCKQFVLSPNKENIKYWQLSTSGVISQDFTWLVSLLRERNVKTPRMLIFFRKIKQLGDLFDYLRSELGGAAYANSEKDEDNNYRNRLFDMFHNKTNTEIKQLVCQSFMEPSGIKRVVLCSTSFSMGLDLKGVDTVIHYGSANDIDDYVQETGRAGRDPTKQAHAVLMRFKGCLNGRRNISDDMKEYVKSKTCRRTQLLRVFEDRPLPQKPPHQCCDNCAMICSCLCKCENICDCDATCSKCKCEVVDLYQASLDSSDTSSSESGAEDQDVTSSDSDIGSRSNRVCLIYSSDEDKV